MKRDDRRERRSTHDEGDFQAYRKFRSYAAESKFQKAYGLFTKSPRLIDYMRVREMPYYALAMHGLGQACGEHFQRELKKRVEKHSQAALGTYDSLASLLGPSRREFPMF